MADVYDGKVYGLFDPLTVAEKPRAIVVTGTTFQLSISRKTGQLISAKVLGTEYIARGSSLPSPYVGIMPADESGATTPGGKGRPRFGYELATGIRPKLFSGGLTQAVRFDAEDRACDSVEVMLADADRVIVRSSGRYGKSALEWEIDYEIEVDGFTKVTVRTRTAEPVLLRWHCYNHTKIASEPVKFLAPWADVNLMHVTGFGPLPSRLLEEVKPGEMVFGSWVNPYFHLGNPQTGIEFSKQDFADRHAGYRDSSTVLEDGTKVDFDSVETADGEKLRPADSRGMRRHLTQVYRREDGYEVEEFDVRNTTIPFNPGEHRERSFWFQLTPAKDRRDELNSCRVVWPGPHQIKMPRWSGWTEPWSPPSDEQLRFWARTGVNLIVGGANYFSGQFSRPTAPEKIRHFLDTAHALGMKVIPYVTFSDYNFTAGGYQEHAADWMASLDIEYKGETTLMCFGAEGWREHFERDVDALLANFPFDGLYIDHWNNTRQCTNARHGCSGAPMRFVVEGYHDIAKRARRVVARHTQGKGIMLLNSGDDAFAGVMSWFDLRLIGENMDPRRVPAVTLQTNYDPERQGIHILAYPSRYSLDLSFINFVESMPFSVRLQVPPESLDQWQDDAPGQPWDGFKPYWDVCRCFGLNQGKLISSFRSEGIARVSHPDGRVWLAVREGRVLVVAGVVNLIRLEKQSQQIDEVSRQIQAAMEKAGLANWLAGDLVRQLRPLMNPVRAAQAFNTVESATQAASTVQAAVKETTFHDTIELLDLAVLKLSPGGKYVVQDLLAHTYVRVDDIREIPVTLVSTRPQVFLIEPAVKAPRVAHFTGVDAAAVKLSGTDMTVRVTATEGSPLALYVDAGKASVEAVTAGFEVEPLKGGLVRVAGAVPTDHMVRLKLV